MVLNLGTKRQDRIDRRIYLCIPMITSPFHLRFGPTANIKINPVLKIIDYIVDGSIKAHMLIYYIDNLNVVKTLTSKEI